MRRYALNPATPVLLRPDGVVQVGWDPRRAVLVCPPSGLSASTLAEVLRATQSGVTLAEIQLKFGFDPSALFSSLADAGVVTNTAPTCPYRVHPHPRPGPAVGSAGGGAALLGGPDHVQQPHACGRSVRDDRPGGAVGLPGVRPAGGARPARRRGAASSGEGARRHGPGGAAGHSRCDELDAMVQERLDRGWIEGVRPVTEPFAGRHHSADCPFIDADPSRPRVCIAGSGGKSPAMIIRDNSRPL